MRKMRMPGGVARGTAAVMTLLMVLCLTFACLTWQVDRVLTDAVLHESIALNERVTSKQMARVKARVDEIAAEHPFQTETVMQFVTEESMAEHSRAVVAWWMGLMQPDPVIEAPEWDTSEIEAAVREDPVFKENTESAFRRTVARDDIAYEVGKAIENAILPVRADLISVFLPKVLEKVNVPGLMGLLHNVPVVLLAVAGVLALAVALLMLRRISFAGMFVGAGLAASALCVAGAGVLMHLLGVTSMVGEISKLLAVQVSLLTRAVALQAGLAALAALAVGLGLMAWHRADLRRETSGSVDA